MGFSQNMMAKSQEGDEELASSDDSPAPTSKRVAGKRSREATVSSEDEMSSSDDSAISQPSPIKRVQLDASNGKQPVSGPRITFSTFEEYSVHYQQNHLNRCSECGTNFPSDHYLQLHIAENHDPIVAIKRERGERTVMN